MALLKELSIAGKASQVQNFMAGDNISFATQLDGRIKISASGGGCVAYSLAWADDGSGLVLRGSESAVVQTLPLTKIRIASGTDTTLVTLEVAKDGDYWELSAYDGTMDQKNWRFFTSSPTIPRVQSWLEGVATVGDVNAGDAALQAQIDSLGEPFRVKQWASNTLNVEIPYCTEDIGNGSIAKMIFSIDAVEGADYQIVGMIAYEVFDAESGGNRINCWPVCQFTGNGQKELSVRWMCGGTTRKTAKRISAWVLLKHR